MANDYFNKRPQAPRYNTKPQAPKKIEAESLPENYVDKAEEVMRSLVVDNQNKLTTSKIRNLLSLVTAIYNEENLRNSPELLPKSRNALTMMRIRVVYEAGREKDTVGSFVEKAKLLEYLKGIGNDREKLIAFAHYMEALVAYHRYLGGREN